MHVEDQFGPVGPTNTTNRMTTLQMEDLFDDLSVAALHYLALCHSAKRSYADADSFSIQLLCVGTSSCNWDRYTVLAACMLCASCILDTITYSFLSCFLSHCNHFIIDWVTELANLGFYCIQQRKFEEAEKFLRNALHVKRNSIVSCECHCVVLCACLQQSVSLTELKGM